MEKLKPTPETIGSIFGVRNPETISLQDKDGNAIEFDQEKGIWLVNEDKEYEVLVQKGTNNDDEFVPINKIFEKVFGGDEDRINNLSLNFYNRIWHQEDVPADFRSKFYSVSSSAEIQAYRQFNWFCEVFGGPSLLGNAEQRDKVLLPRVMAKHTQSRMTKDYAITWLKLMDSTLDEEFPDQPEVKALLGLYWLHFYAFFPYEEKDRKEFRRVVLGWRRKIKTTFLDFI